MLPPPPLPWLAISQDAVLALMSGYSPQLWLIGMNLFKSFAAIHLVWFGVQVALGKRDDSVAEFVSLVLWLSFGFAIVTFYGSELPVIGYSFSNLIPAMGAHVAGIMDASAVETTAHGMDVMLARFITPSVVNIGAWIEYDMLLGLMGITKAIVFLLSGIPLIGESLCILLGGLFMPFVCSPIPQLEGLFWGWIKAIMYCSFARVVGLAYLFILAKVVNGILLSAPPTIDASQYPAYIVMLLSILTTFVFGAVLIPALCSMFFSGVHLPSVSIPRL